MIQNTNLSSAIGKKVFSWGERTYIVGIVNLTRDSFSGDGLIKGVVPTKKESQKAVDMALQMEDDGADIVDVGGMSSKPKRVYGETENIGVSVEIERTSPLISRLVDRLDIPVSIDTTRAQVAMSALEAGATIVNDVSMLSDSDMNNVLGKADALVVGHNKEIHLSQNENLAKKVAFDLKTVLSKITTEDTLLIADIGLGFSKNANQNIALLKGLGELKRELNIPVMVGASRKLFTTTLTGAKKNEHLGGSLAVGVYASLVGADIVRVHDVKLTASALNMAKLLKE